MAGGTPRAPRIRDILLGLIALVALTVVLVNLAVLIKLVGNALLVIPSALGVVRQVTRDEVFTYDLVTSPTEVGFGQPGCYAVYAYDYDLLTTSDALEEAGAPPWITLVSRTTGEAVPIMFVGRGLRPYDTVLAKGRPVLTFVITRPGAYLMYHPARRADLAIVRDYITGQERTIVAAYLVQIGVVVGPPAILLTRRYLARRHVRREAQRARREQADAFWQRRQREGETWRRPP